MPVIARLGRVGCSLDFSVPKFGDALISWWSERKIRAAENDPDRRLGSMMSMQAAPTGAFMYAHVNPHNVPVVFQLD